MITTIFYVPVVFALLWALLVFIFALNVLCPKTEQTIMSIIGTIVATELLRIVILAGIFGVFYVVGLVTEAVTIHANNYWWIIGMGFGEGAWIISEYCTTVRLMNEDAERAAVTMLLAHIDTCITILSWVLFLLA